MVACDEEITAYGEVEVAVNRLKV
jgi:hypothetical protein